MKVDVVIHVCGKPFQTALALLSLLKYSGRHIGHIYFIEENTQEDHYCNAGNHDFILNKLKRKIRYYQPKEWLWINPVDLGKLHDEQYRYAIRYQYGWEKSDEDYIFILHNDIVVFDDIIGAMLNVIGDYIAVGNIGQCWNCPASWTGKCSSEMYWDYRPSFDELVHLYEDISPPENRKKRLYLDTTSRDFFKICPWPLPECRVNEYAAIINLKLARNTTCPIGTAIPFGAYIPLSSLLDIGVAWFRDISHMGFKAKNIQIHNYMHHAPGHPAMFNQDRYISGEEKALKILEQEFFK